MDFDAKRKQQPVVEEETRETELAFALGQAGTIQNVVGPQGFTATQAFFQVQLPAHLARTWEVNVLAMQTNAKANAGAATVPAPASGYRARHASSTRYNSDTLKLRLEYGTDAAMERCLFDYPFNGGTFEVTAATVRLFLENPFPGTAVDPVGQLNFYQATVGAFISPKCFSRGKALMQPTFSYPIATQIPAGGGSRFFFAPERAVGYRVFSIDDSIAANDLLEVTQGIFGAGFVDVQRDTPTAASMSAHPYPIGNGNGPGTWYPLHPMATCIQVETKAAGAVDAFVCVQFVLDIG